MRALLVIDVQKEFIDSNGRYYEAVEFIKRSKKNYDCVIAIAFKNKESSRFSADLAFNGCMHTDKNSIEFDYDCFFIKDTYSFDVKQFLPKGIEYDVIGCNTEACVLATCFRLWDEEYKFNVLIDKVYSTCAGLDKQQVELMFNNTFGKCIKKSDL